MNKYLKIIGTVLLNAFSCHDQIPNKSQMKKERYSDSQFEGNNPSGREGMEVEVGGSSSYCICNQEAELGDRKRVLDLKTSKLHLPMNLTGSRTVPPAGTTHADTQANGEHSMAHHSNPVSNDHWVLAMGRPFRNMLILTITWKGMV